MGKKIQHEKIMKSLVHRKELLQMFSGTLEIKNFWRSVELVEQKRFWIIGMTWIKGQTKFTRENFPEPHPRIHVEIFLFWNWDEDTLNLCLRVLNLENQLPGVRYCLETYVGNSLNTNVIWIDRYYFGKQPNVFSLIDKPVTLWKWFVDRATHSVRYKGDIIGNLTGFLNNGDLTIRIELLAMSIMKVTERLMRPPLLCGRVYMELIFSRYCGPLEAMYRECGGFDLCLFSVDSKSFFLCHKAVVCAHSSVLSKQIFDGPEDKPVSCIKIDGANTDTVRMMLYYMYQNEIDPRWIRIPVMLLDACLHFRVDGITQKIVTGIKGKRPATYEFTVLVWLIVRNYKQISLLIMKSIKNKMARPTASIVDAGTSVKTICGNGLKQVALPSVEHQNH